MEHPTRIDIERQIGQEIDREVKRERKRDLSMKMRHPVVA